MPRLPIKLRVRLKYTKAGTRSVELRWRAVARRAGVGNREGTGIAKLVEEKTIGGVPIVSPPQLVYVDNGQVMRRIVAN